MLCLEKARGQLAPNRANHKLCKEKTKGRMMFRPIAILAFVCLVAFVVYAKAGGAGVPLPERNPLRPHGAAAKAPVLPGDQPTLPCTHHPITDATPPCPKP